MIFKGVLFIFYPGEYVIGALLFLLTLFVIKRDLQKLESLTNPLSDDDERTSLLNENDHDNTSYTNEAINATDEEPINAKIRKLS